MDPLDRFQFSFAGGMNAFDDDHAIGEDEYGEAFNIRCRDNTIKVNYDIEHDSTAPVGKKQGIVGFDKYLILFNSGLAYYKDISLSSDTWHIIDGYIMNGSVDRIYTQAVPASTLNVQRKLITAGQTSGSPSSTELYKTNIIINGTVAGLVCQDGVSQPYIILPDGTARRLASYLEWTTDNREYVPIGKHMAYMNDILFIGAPDGKSFYRSVSGRPLDFVVNVDVNGNKGGDASTTSYAVSYDPMTGMFPLNSGQLLVTTEKVLYPIDINFETTIFAEPTFKNINQKIVGNLNQFTFIELLNDYAFIDTDGIRSINAVAQTNNEGRNTIFSKRVSKLINGIRQRKELCCAYVFDNYALFSLTSVYGSVVLVYDLLTEKWISIDYYEIGAVKQMASATIDYAPRLFCITGTSVYEMFASSDFASGSLKLKTQVNTEQACYQLRLDNVMAIFLDSDSEAFVTCTQISDSKEGNSVRKRLSDTYTGVGYPALYPVEFSSKSRTDPIMFNFNLTSKTGWKVGVKLEWANAARLALVQYKSDPQTNTNPMNRGAKVYGS